MRARTTAAIAAAALAIPFAANASAEPQASRPTSARRFRRHLPSRSRPRSRAPAPPRSPAPRSPLNIASDKAALNAYAGYLTAVLRATSTGQSNSNSYISTISSQCRSALSPLAEPNYQVSASAQATLTAVGEEMGDDLSITFDQAFLTPFAKLSASLERLKWTHGSDGVLIVRRLVAAQSTVLYTATSNLCQSALLASASPQLIPPGTKTFTRAYAKASKQANAALANLLALMQAYETQSEKPVVSRIATLVGQISKTTRTDLQASASSLSNLLEST